MLIQRFYCGAITCWILAFPLSAVAHPMGNFSLDQHSQLDVGLATIRLRQVLDMAEIPTLQETGRIDTDKNGTLSEAELVAYAATITPNYSKNLILTVNGAVLPLRVETQNIHLVAGAASLQTLHIEWVFSANFSANENTNTVTFRNDNYSERIGSRAITVHRASGVEIFDSSAFGADGNSKVSPPKAVSLPLSVKSQKVLFYFRLFPGKPKSAATP